MPSAKSSMNSRARFSFGAPTRLVRPSNHTSMAGSTIIAWANDRKSPVPSRRSDAFWASRYPGWLTFCALVAKWPCQNQVRRSGSGDSVAHIRSSHHRVRVFWPWARCCCAALRAGVPGWPRSRIEGSAGGGVAATPASGGDASIAENPCAIAAGSSPGRAPKPKRSNNRRVATASGTTVTGRTVLRRDGGRQGPDRRAQRPFRNPLRPRGATSAPGACRGGRQAPGSPGH